MRYIQYMNNSIIDILKIAWPVLALQLIVQLIAIIDIARKKKTRNLTPAIWIVIIMLGEILGPIVYFIVGRAEED